MVLLMRLLYRTVHFKEKYKEDQNNGFLALTLRSVLFFSPTKFPLCSSPMGCIHLPPSSPTATITSTQTHRIYLQT